MGNSIDLDSKVLLEGDSGQALGNLNTSVRKAEVVVRVNTSVPKEAGCLFEAGGAQGSGTFVGIVREACDDSKCKSSVGGLRPFG